MKESEMFVTDKMNGVVIKDSCGPIDGFSCEFYSAENLKIVEVNRTYLVRTLSLSGTSYSILNSDAVFSMLSAWGTTPQRDGESVSLALLPK